MKRGFTAMRKKSNNIPSGRVHNIHAPDKTGLLRCEEHVYLFLSIYRVVHYEFVQQR